VTFVIAVKAVNDPPAGTDKTITTNEDAAYTFTAADFGFSDPVERDVTTLPDFTVLLSVAVPQSPVRPSAWVHEMPGGGRVFYTGFGHAASAFQEPEVMRFIMTGIKWAAHRL